LGLIGLKAHVLSTLERNSALVELAQGKMDGALSFFTGSNSFIIESMYNREHGRVTDTPD